MEEKHEAKGNKVAYEPCVENVSPEMEAELSRNYDPADKAEINARRAEG